MEKGKEYVGLCEEVGSDCSSKKREMKRVIE